MWVLNGVNYSIQLFKRNSFIVTKTNVQCLKTHIKKKIIKKKLIVK